jgi:CHAD domain-containing protein/CYTH domain-containing protein
MADTPHTSVLELPVRAGIRLVALGRLDDALAARERLVHARDDEALHDFRVALRRLRSGLRAYERWFTDTIGRSDRRKLKRLAGATGDARDIEVHLAWLDRAALPGSAADGGRVLRNHLEAKRKAADRAARRSAHHFPAHADNRRGGFERYTAELDPAHPVAVLTMGTVTARLAREQTDDLRTHVEAMREDDDPAVAHRARIEGKRLRYLVEPFAGDVALTDDVLSMLRSLQNDLGSLHDLDVLMALVGGLDADEAEAVALAGLAAYLGEQRTSHLERVRSHHLEEAAADLGRRVDQLAEVLDSAGATADVEIERKFLLNGLPRRRKGRSVVRIDQGWLPGERIVERFRRIRDGDSTTWVRTIKFGRGLVRREVEEEIDEAMFRRVWPLTRDLRISKRRYSFRDGDRVWTVDRFLDRDLILAEIELDSPDDDVEPPEWLSRYIEREVTGLAGYQNVHLAELVGDPDRGG